MLQWRIPPPLPHDSGLDPPLICYVIILHVSFRSPLTLHYSLSTNLSNSITQCGETWPLIGYFHGYYYSFDLETFSQEEKNICSWIFITSLFPPLWLKHVESLSMTLKEAHISILWYGNPSAFDNVVLLPFGIDTVFAFHWLFKRGKGYWSHVGHSIATFCL